MHLIPQTSTGTPFRAPIPDILSFVRLGFSPEKREKVKYFNYVLNGLCIFQKIRRIVCISSIKKVVFKYFYTFYFRMFLIKRNKIYNMKRYAETGSRWQAPVSSLNYWVVVPPFMTHDC